MLASATLLVLVARAMIPTVNLAPKVAVLETRAVSALPPGACHGIQEPRAILLEISRTHLLVGEEGRAPRRAHDLSTVALLLEGYKRARPERPEVIIQAHDEVSYERIATVLDLLVALELPSSSLYVGPPAGSQTAPGCADVTGVGGDAHLRDF